MIADNPPHGVTDCLAELHSSIMDAVRWTVDSTETKEALLDAIASLDRLCQELGHELGVARKPASDSTRLGDG